jgi:dihydroorotate dehydrogenase (NAD+) catalytic subunit
MSDLFVNIAGVRLKNPVIPASGTFEYHNNLFSPSQLGAVINKTITLHKRAGNPPPRTCETASGMLNAIGIPSEGLEHFIEHELPLLRSFNTVLIISVAAFTIEEFYTICRRIEQEQGVGLIELNLSCPNLERGYGWSVDKKLLAQVITAIKKSIKTPIIAKLSPNVTDIAEMAYVAQEQGADALSIVNTYQGMAIDIITRKPLLGNIHGGLSGPAIKPLAINAVYRVYERVSIPIIGMGGITETRDAIEFLLAGASAVAVGMYNFVNPLVMPQIINGLDAYLKENKFSAIKEIVGLAHEKD